MLLCNSCGAVGPCCVGGCMCTWKCSWVYGANGVCLQSTPLRWLFSCLEAGSCGRKAQSWGVALHNAASPWGEAMLCRALLWVVRVRRSPEGRRWRGKLIGGSPPSWLGLIILFHLFIWENCNCPPSCSIQHIWKHVSFFLAGWGSWFSEVFHLHLKLINHPLPSNVCKIPWLIASWYQANTLLGIQWTWHSGPNS